MMNANDILDLVGGMEDERAGFHKNATEWEKMWKLEAFTESREEALRQGREQVVLPDPRNVVNLALRLFTSKPVITCPSEAVTDVKDDNAGKRAQFLEGLWHRSNREGRIDVVRKAAMYGLVRGRFAFDVRWIQKAIPEGQRGRRMPLLLRALDPLNTGVRVGPTGPRWAYHKYEASFADAVQQWPDRKRALAQSKSIAAKREDDAMLEIVDFWWIDQGTGKVWNGVLCEDQFLKKPQEMLYPDLPIVEGYCDYSPFGGESLKGMSILANMEQTWKYKCRLASQMATGVMFYFWPLIIVQNENGAEIGEMPMRPGATFPVPAGTKIEHLRFEPNVPIAATMQGIIDSADSQSTFPGVLYGSQPGDVQAGYAINILSEAARGRIYGLVSQLEWAMMTINEIALSLVEKMASPTKGVAVWGYDEAVDKVANIVLLPDEVAGYVENMVKLGVNVPNDDMAKKALGLQEVDKGIFSKSYYRRHMSNKPVPADEETRVLVEQAMTNPKFMELAGDRAIKSYYGDDKAGEILGQPKPSGGWAPPGVPNYRPAEGPMTCAGCIHAEAGICGAYDFEYDPTWVCNSFLPYAEMPGPQGGPPGIQGPGVMPGGPIPPMEQGQLSPGAFGMNPTAPPQGYEGVMGGGPPTLETMAQRARGGRGSSE